MEKGLPNFWSCNIIFKMFSFQENIRYAEAKSGSYTEGKKQSIETVLEETQTLYLFNNDIK